MRLKDLGERALLAKLAPLGYPEAAPLPPGDDAGGVWADGVAWLLKTDGFLYRDVALRGMGPFEVGFRGVAATASDLLVKMGRPLGFTLGLFLPEDLEEGFVLELVRGAAEAAKRLGAFLLGGDTNRGMEVALTVSGYALAEAPLPRKALPGDLLYLAGDRWGRTGAAIRAHYEGRSLEGFPEISGGGFLPPASPGASRPLRPPPGKPGLLRRPRRDPLAACRPRGGGGGGGPAPLPRRPGLRGERGGGLGARPLRGRGV